MDNEILKVASSSITQKDGFPGKSVVSTCDGYQGDAVRAEVYGIPGVLCVPPDGANLIFVPAGGSRKSGVAVAGHNYKIDFDLSQGETVLHSTDAAGGTVKAKIEMKNTGKIRIENELHDFKTLFTELTGILKALRTVGAPPQHTVDPAIIAEIVALETKINQIFD